MAINDLNNIQRIDFKNVPAALQRDYKFVLWRAELKPDSNEYAKVPYQPNGSRAKINDNKTWYSFNEVAAAYKDSQSKPLEHQFHGIHAVLNGAHTVIDIDNIKSDNNKYKNASNLMKDVSSLAYVEASPSGTGLHYWLKNDGVTKHKNKKEISGVTVEMYSNNRFMSVTGEAGLNNQNNFNTDNTTVVNKFIQKNGFNKNEITTQSSNVYAAEMTKDNVLNLLHSASNKEKFEALFNGDVSGDESSNDYALAGMIEFYVGNNPELIKNIMLDSALKRTKWDTTRSGQTYLDITINQVIKANAGKEHYKMKTPQVTQIEKSQDELDSELIASLDMAAYKDKFIIEVKDTENKPYIKTGFDNIDNLLDGGLTPQTLYFMGAISSLGKTTLMLQIADNIAASGIPVLYVSLEQGKQELAAKSISRLTAEIIQEKPQTYAYTTPKTMNQIRDKRKQKHFNDTDTKLVNEATNRYFDSIDGNLFIMQRNSLKVDVTALEGALKAIERKYTQINPEAPIKTPVILFDYLQIMDAPDGMERSTDKQITDKNVTDMKRIAREYNTPVLAISSLNRENYSAAISMQAFKESGAIEYSSDVLIGLQYAAINNPTHKLESRFKVEADRIKAIVRQEKARDINNVEFILLKNRNGRIASTELELNKATNMYSCYAKGEAKYKNYFIGSRLIAREKRTGLLKTTTAEVYIKTDGELLELFSKQGNEDVVFYLSEKQIRDYKMLDNIADDTDDDDI